MHREPNIKVNMSLEIKTRKRTIKMMVERVEPPYFIGIRRKHLKSSSRDSVSCYFLAFKVEIEITKKHKDLKSSSRDMLALIDNTHNKNKGIRQ